MGTPYMLWKPGRTRPWPERGPRQEPFKKAGQSKQAQKRRKGFTAKVNYGQRKATGMEQVGGSGKKTALNPGKNYLMGEH